MTRLSREKGKRGEREVVSIIHDLLGVNASRRVRQHDGDSDVIGVPGWSIEVKRRAVVTEGMKRQWWDQACVQANDDERPCVWYRANRSGWRVIWSVSECLSGSYWGGWEYCVESSPEAWAAVVRECYEFTAKEKEAWQEA
ncbi:hypothetical protein IRY61_02605 [Candidatus Saccharibacteria bacterium]|nr:hypothetical protein [Candidatus Saccharibacteria bacterium]